MSFTFDKWVKTQDKLCAYFTDRAGNSMTASEQAVKRVVAEGLRKEKIGATDSVDFMEPSFSASKVAMFNHPNYAQTR